ncbi:FAD-dependent monooxygenase [Candidatus Uhrbacteria bacterium]|nr:FAD-dependent monooxygenase [Candidatus Uhrbacteria bacterium]
MENFDVIIVGASFSGLSLAHHLPRYLRVLVCDVKPTVGSSVESTGLITTRTREELASFYAVDSHITNAIKSICVVAPGFKDHFISKVESPWIFQTDTCALVAGLAAALPSNVTVMPGTCLVGVRQTADGVQNVRLLKDGVNLEVGTRFLVGADGGRSKVASLIPGLDRNRRFLFGHERVVPGEVLLGDTPEETIYHYWFGEFSLGYGGWLSPTYVLGRKAFRVGLAKDMRDRGDAAILTDAFLEKLQEVGHIKLDPGGAVGSYSFGGLIPIGGTLRRISKKNVLLIGDAAGFCGAFAADGIKGSVISGKEAAPLIQSYLNGQSRAPARLPIAMQKHGGLLSYYRRQLRYRWIWDLMRRDQTFRAMFDVIAAEKDGFLAQFCDSKDKRRSLVSIVLKPRHLLRLLDYVWNLSKDRFVGAA